MLRLDYNRHNAYFTTYHIYDTEKGHYIGIIEDHDRQLLRNNGERFRTRSNVLITEG